MTVAELVGQAGWVDAAACRGRDTALWFSADRFEQAVAIAVCRRCPVRQRCLAEALAEEAGAPTRFGVRGGKTAPQRAVADW